MLEVFVGQTAPFFGRDGKYIPLWPALAQLTVARKRARAAKGSQIARILDSQRKTVAYQIYKERAA